MKKAIIITLLILVMNPGYVHAKAGLLSFGGEEIVEVVKLPNDERFQIPEGQYVDIGYIYKSVAVLFVPIWNYDGRLVGITGQEDTYLNLSPEEITDIVSEAGMKLPEKPYLDFWHRIGGKIVFLIALLAFGFNAMNKIKKKASFLSSLPTGRERLRDILTSSQEFTELDPATLNIEGKTDVEGLYFIGVKNYFNSFISVSVFDMNKVSVEQIQSNNDDLFERLLVLRKMVSSKARSSIHYIYFTFDKSPNNDDIALLKSLKKRKIRNATNVIPGIIDFEKMEIDTAASTVPSKKILENCFIQAKQEELLVTEAKM
ncbi:hypothetical protein [Shewanella salipaludis]|uniref:Uncharacterized protein n=1 Tax=Shewanella salipaludis TaxID=2723052 RepID=A0A972G420_9GAMM|nr:hypothetical protein [Shewanella salipaludis]NMH66824.1 hypothetical protein [Shewanella salipaludis]